MIATAVPGHLDHPVRRVGRDEARDVPFEAGAEVFLRPLGREPGSPQVPPQVPGQHEGGRDEDQARDPQDPAAAAPPATGGRPSGDGAALEDLGLGHPLKCRRFGRVP